MEYRTANESLSTFFKYLGMGFVISAIKINLTNVPLISIVENLLLTFLYNFIFGIWFGLANMIIIDLYFFIKNRQ